MKIIFLDIDGVLNSFQKHADRSVPHNVWRPEVMQAMGIELEVYPDLVERLNLITETTGARIVISSSWRIGYLADWSDVVIHLHNAGLKGFILGRTPWGENLKTRGAEVAAWFGKHPDEKVDSFVILDDNPGMEPYNDHFIQTDHKVGLQSRDIEEAIHMLNGE
jgi:hypothetical protein